MSLSDRIPIHGGHPFCECGKCSESMLITWSFWRGLQNEHGRDVYIVLPIHIEPGDEVLVTTPLYAVVKLAVAA